MKLMIWFLLILSALIVLNFTHNIYLNIFTHSLPSGIYFRIKGIPQRNDYAATCLTSEIAKYGINRGYLAQGNCETGTVLVLKMIKGIPGDRFMVKDEFLEVNGDSYRIINNDSSGRVLKSFYDRKESVIEKDKYILLSDFVPNSWDSRYWGPVSIEFLLKPFWIIDYAKK
jgi:conjugative transfer signal peptidase TraF